MALPTAAENRILVFPADSQTPRTKKAAGMSDERSCQRLLLFPCHPPSTENANRAVWRLLFAPLAESFINPLAMTYSPGQSPTKYHRRCRA
jgi:hypothetical protein